MARTKSTNKNRAVGYVRRSTDRQEQSIPDQKKALEDYAAEHDLRLTKFYVDDAMSGASTLGKRAFQKMIADAQSSRRDFSIVIVYDVKRFGRIDNDEAGYYRHILRANGVEILYVSENFNGDCTDDLLRPVKQWQARQESKDLSKVTIRGLLSKSETGCWLGGVPPYGYDLRYEDADGKFLFVLRHMSDGSKQVLNDKGKLTRTLARGESLSISKRDKARLILSATERVEVIKRIFKMYVSLGKGYRAIADTLNAEGAATPRGPQWSRIYSGKWTGTTIRAMLVNLIYAGDMVWNRRADGRFHRISRGKAVDREGVHGARLVPNGKEDWIIVRNAHPSLISRRLFERAKNRLENHPKSKEQQQNNHGKTWNGKRSRFILSGLVRCTICGNRYQGVTRNKGKPKNDGSSVKTYYYGCAGYMTKGGSICQPNLVPQKILESAVIAGVLDFYRPYLESGGERKLAQAVKAQTKTESREITSARRKVKRELTAVEAKSSKDYVVRTRNRLKKIISNCRFYYFRDITQSAVEIYLGKLKKDGYGKTSIGHYLDTLKTFLNWAEQDQRIIRNPITKLDKPDRDSKSKGVLTPKQFVYLIKHTFEKNVLIGRTTGQERAVLYALAGCTGLRRKELLTLTWDDINLSADNAYVRVKACLAKNAKEAKQPIPPFILSVLTALKASTRPELSDRVFISFGKWINTAELIRADLTAAGIELTDKDGNEICFHSLRNSYISFLANSQTPAKVVQKLARHSDPRLTF
ncbi:MAG: recombinase family protein, partial [Planctomycetota bacterium]